MPKRRDSRGGGPMQMHGRKDLRPMGVPGFMPAQLAKMARQLADEKAKQKALESVLEQHKAAERKLNR